MTLYILGHWLSHYEFAHSEVAVCLNAAKGFRAAGIDAKVVWFGETKLYEGVPHVAMAEAKPASEDILLVMHPTIACATTTDERMLHLLNAGQKWIYTNGAYGDPKPGACIYHKEWNRFDRIFVESEQSVAAVKAQFPDKPVHLCWLGCTHDLDLESLTDPYPHGSNRNIFFAGRLTHPEEMQTLMSMLPERYRLWIAARTIYYKNRWYYVRKPGEPPQAKWSPDSSFTELGHEEGGQLIAEIFPPRCRATYLGALPFGSFWDRHHFAFASLDIGLEAMPPCLNCKIFDALRAGGRVITYGQSPSYFLLDKYQGQGSLPWKDFEGMMRVLEGWNHESRELRFERALHFRDGESWHQRVKGIIEQTGIA